MSWTHRTQAVPSLRRRMARTIAGVAAASLAAGQLVVTYAGTASAASTSSPTVTFGAPSISGSTARVSYTVNRAPRQIAGGACTLTPKGGTTSSASCGAQTGSSATSTSYAVTLSGLSTTSYTYKATVKLTDGGSGTNSTTFAVKLATATCAVTSYTTTYDGGPHTATGTCTGAGGVNLSADLNLTGTTHTNAGSYPSDPWSFTDPTGNYTNPGGAISDSIGQATANCSVTSYSVTYDASPHTATGSCTGLNGAHLPSSDLDLTNTTHTNVGSHTDAWSFSDPNYTNPGGTVSDAIGQATASCTVSSYSVTYDANPHTATGTCAGVGGVDLTADLDASSTAHTNAGTYPGDQWSFTDPTGNYTNTGGTVSDAIAPATANCTVTAYSATYDSHPRTATGSCTGAGGVDLSADLNLTSTTHTGVGSYPSDHWSFTDPGGNYTNPGGAVADVIAAPLPAVAQIHVNYPNDPQDVIVPPSDVTHCPAQDSDDGGCAINALDGTIDNVFDASSSIDPNVDPSHDRVEYHWQIFYPSIFGEQVLYSAAGITGYHSPVLHIAAGSLPELDGDPRVGADIFWRVELTITVNGYTNTVVYFRFAYSSDFSLQISSDCQLTGQFMGLDCAVIAAQLLPATEPV